MDDLTNLVEFAEEMVKEKTGDYLSELQRLILLSSLQGDRKTYDQIAEDCGYSPKYVRQDVAPKLWQLLTEVLAEKISKSNIKAVLQRRIRHSSASSPASPVKQVESVPMRPVSSLSLSRNPTRGNILLVDDQPQNLNLLAELLEEQGYEVREAINGELALQTVTMKAPDLILLDINMPDLDGYTVCQRLKGNAQTQDIPVIFISALDEAWDKVRGFSVGGVDYITKPFKAMEVLARVENHLKTGQLYRELMATTFELEQVRQELSQLKRKDPVTQLGNHLDFEDYLADKWQEAGENAQSLTLILAQVNQFQSYCDRYGMSDGNHCLYQVAKKLREVFHAWQEGVFNDEERRFAIILLDVPSNEVNSLTDRLVKEITMLPLSASVTLNLRVQTVTPSAEMIVEDWVQEGLQGLNA